MRWWMVLAVGCAAPDPATESDDVSQTRAFQRAAGLTDAPDVETVRLCAEAEDPDGAADVQDIDCAVEIGRVGMTSEAVSGPLTVMAYNIERGHRLDGFLAWLDSDDAPRPDVLLLSEADRGCARTGDRHVAWELAEALDMELAYAVEFMEVRGTGDQVTEVCEHGNAILSRQPLGNVEAFRHRTNVSWYTPPEDRGASWGTRLGGRVAVVADILVGDDLVRLTSVHLASGALDQEVRADQAREVVEWAADVEGPVVSGGDMNAGGYVVDLAGGSAFDGVSQAFFAQGYTDSHATLPYEERATIDQFGLVIDLLMLRDAVSAEPELCVAPCEAFSDHYPVWATISW